MSQRAHFFKGQLKFMDDEVQIRNRIEEEPSDTIDDDGESSIKEKYRHSNILLSD